MPGTLHFFSASARPEPLSIMKTKREPL